MDDTDRTTSEEPAASAPGRAPLRRRGDDSIVAGVASGLAAYLNVDPALVRIGFVVLLFAGGVGLPAYVAGWLLIPEADEQETAAQELIRSKGPGFWIGIGLLVLVALAVTDALAFGRGWWPLVLIAAGVALWRAGQRPPDAPATAAPAADRSEHLAGPYPSQEDPMPTSTPSPPSTAPREPVAFSPPPLPARRSGPLSRVTVALALIAAGVAVVLDRVGLVDAHIGHVLAASLVVVGLGLVVGAWWGRARALIIPGLILVPMVVLAALFQATAVPWDAGFGERTIDVEAAELAPTYRLAAGELTLRLDRLPQDAGEVAVSVEVGAGKIHVRVPSDATVRIRARTNAGDLQLFDRSVSGVGDLDETFVRQGEPGAPTIVLDLRVAVGQIVVRPGAASTTPANS